MLPHARTDTPHLTLIREEPIEQQRAIALCNAFGAFVSRFYCNPAEESLWPDFLTFRNIIDYLHIKRLLSHSSLKQMVYLVNHREEYRNISCGKQGSRCESSGFWEAQLSIEDCVSDWMAKKQWVIPQFCCGGGKVSLSSLSAVPTPAAFGLCVGESLCAFCGGSKNLQPCPACRKVLYCEFNHCRLLDSLFHAPHCLPSSSQKDPVEPPTLPRKTGCLQNSPLEDLLDAANFILEDSFSTP